MKNITRTITTTHVKAYAMANGKPKEHYFDVVGEKLEEEKAKKIALEKGLLFDSMTFDEKLYKIAVEDFVRHATIVEDEQEEKENEQ